MEISAKMVKELREMTGAGMMDCKVALTETAGDIDEAIEYLRKKGKAKAEKKAGRIAAEGLCRIANDGDKSAVVVEVNSETDFVAKNDEFINFADDVARTALSSTATDMEGLLADKWILDSNKTVEEVLVEKVAFIGENLSIRRFCKVEADNGCVVSYVHGGGRIGVIVEAECSVINDEIKEALSNVAMQIAALSPKYVSGDEISDEYKAHEKDILLAQIKEDPSNASKPEQIIEKMILGRLNKELKEICLLDQAYVKDGDVTVGKYVDSVAKATNSGLKVVRFVRFETGEGLEKKSEDFAAEVAAQMGM